MSDWTEREGDEQGKKCQHRTGFGILDLAAAGGSARGEGWLHWEGLGISLSCRSGEDEVFAILTAVMHGVTGDDHW